MNPSSGNLFPVEEFDYPTLMGALAGYAHPRDKISQLLRNGTLVRVKKGLYIFGKAYRLRPFSPEILANLIYGPSFISFDYALQYPRLHLAHLEQRMRQSGHWTDDKPITESAFSHLMNEAIHRLNIHQAAQEVEPFVKGRRALELWSREFFVEISKRIELV